MTALVVALPRIIIDLLIFTMIHARELPNGEPRVVTNLYKKKGTKTIFENKMNSSFHNMHI